MKSEWSTKTPSSASPLSPTCESNHTWTLWLLYSAWIVKSGLALQRSELELSGFRTHERPELPESAETVGKPADEKCAERQEPAQAQVREDFRPLPTWGGEGKGSGVGGWVVSGGGCGTEACQLQIQPRNLM